MRFIKDFSIFMERNKKYMCEDVKIILEMDLVQLILFFKIVNNYGND